MASQRRASDSGVMSQRGTGKSPFPVKYAEEPGDARASRAGRDALCDEVAEYC